MTEQEKRIIAAAIAYVERSGSGTSDTSKELYYAVKALQDPRFDEIHPGR